MRDILIVAATDRELCGRDGLVCGIGPVEAAARTARTLALHPPRALLHIGIAGARGLEPGSLVVGTAAVYLDLAAAIPVESRLEPDPALLAAARDALPGAAALPIGTSAAVGKARDSLLQGPPGVEAMEGFAVLRAAAIAGIPALEVRAISNEIGEADRARWRIPEGLEALARALETLMPALDARR